MDIVLNEWCFRELDIYDREVYACVSAMNANNIKPTVTSVADYLKIGKTIVWRSLKTLHEMKFIDDNLNCISRDDGGCARNTNDETDKGNNEYGCVIEGFSEHYRGIKGIEFIYDGRTSDCLQSMSGLVVALMKSRNMFIDKQNCKFFFDEIYSTACNMIKDNWSPGVITRNFNQLISNRINGKQQGNTEGVSRTIADASREFDEFLYSKLQYGKDV